MIIIIMYQKGKILKDPSMKRFFFYIIIWFKYENKIGLVTGVWFVYNHLFSIKWFLKFFAGER